MLGWATQVLAAGGDAKEPGFDRTVRSHLQVTNQRASGLGPHTMTIRNTSALTLRIEPRLVGQWPKSGNGIDVELGPLRLGPNAQQDIAYTISTNDAADADPFRMARRYELQVSADDAPTTTTTVPLVLSASLDPAGIVRVRTPAVGPSGSYVCAAAELGHVPQPLWPVHCRNTLAAVQARSFPLELHLGEADPLQHAYLRRLQLDHLYHTRYEDGSTEPLNCASSCTIDFSHGRNLFDYVPGRPELGHVLEPLLEGLPRISRSMLGEEPDIVLEVERRPDLMDPTTRVDTIQAVCLGNDCGSGAIVIDAIERVDDVGHGFAPPPRDEIRRYAPDGELSPAMILSPAGPRDRAEVAWRITDASGGAYVESHYEIRYHATDGQPRRLVSPGFGGILEPAWRPVRAGSRAETPKTLPPPWASHQLSGPFLRLEVADATMTTRSVHWATPPLDSHMRLLSVLVTGEAGRMGSGTLVGMPQLRADRTIDQFKVLTALHVLLPLYHNGLSVAEYLGLYDAALEVAVSEDWFRQEHDIHIPTPDPTAAFLPQPAILGYSFHSLRNAVVEVSAPQLPPTPGLRVPDLAMYTVHPAATPEVSRESIDAAPLLQFPLPLVQQTLDGPVSMLGFPVGAKYQVVPPGSTPIEFHPLVHSRFPALRNRVSSEFLVPFNSHELMLGARDQYRYTLLNPLTGEELVTGDNDWIYSGLSGAGVLSHLQWAGASLQRAVFHGEKTHSMIQESTGEVRLLYIALDVDPAQQEGRDYHLWLVSHVP